MYAPSPPSPEEVECEIELEVVSVFERKRLLKYFVKLKRKSSKRVNIFKNSDSRDTPILNSNPESCRLHGALEFDSISETILFITYWNRHFVVYN